jgi:predicted DNA binding CopG/RHH family protein
VRGKQIAKKGKAMRSIEKRAKFDSFELKDNYDFTSGVRGRFYQPKKVPISMRLDNDILIFLKKEASEKKIAYQTLINNLLREHTQIAGLRNEELTRKMELVEKSSIDNMLNLLNNVQDIEPKKHDKL